MFVTRNSLTTALSQWWRWWSTKQVQSRQTAGEGGETATPSIPAWPRVVLCSIHYSDLAHKHNDQCVVPVEWHFSSAVSETHEHRTRSLKSPDDSMMMGNTTNATKLTIHLWALLDGPLHLWKAKARLCLHHNGAVNKMVFLTSVSMSTCKNC